MSESELKETEQKEELHGDDVVPEVDEEQEVDEETSELSQREREQNAINAVNNSSYYENRKNMANYEMQSVAEAMKHAPKWGIVFGLVLFFSLVADLIVATVLLINGYWIGAIVCAALFAVILITMVTATFISRALAMNGDISKAEKIAAGKVKACFMMGTATAKSGGGQRINGVTYRVIVISDGKEYGAFTKQFYEPDEKVVIAVMGKKRAKILEEAELEKLNISKTEIDG